MKKKRQSAVQKKAAIKRGLKRSGRLKTTKSEKSKKKLDAIKEKQRLQEKQNEEIRKILESRTQALS